MPASGGNETRASLLGRVKDSGDNESWRTFHDIYSRLIRSQARNCGLNDAEVEDVAQETLIEIAERIKTFNYDKRAGSFRAWLFQLTRWRILNYIKKSRRAISLETMDETEGGANVPAALTTEFDQRWEQEWQQTVLDSAMRVLKRRWEPRHFQIIDLLITKQWSVAKVSETVGINRARLYLLKFRAVHQLRREFARLKDSDSGDSLLGARPGG